MTSTTGRKKGEQYDGEAKFCVYNHYEHEATVVWKSQYTNHAGVLTVPVDGTRCVWVPRTAKGKAAVGLYYNKKRIDEAKLDTTTAQLYRPRAENLSLEGLCQDGTHARFRVANENRQTVPVTLFTLDDGHDNADCVETPNCNIDWESATRRYRFAEHFYVRANDAREISISLDRIGDGPVVLWYMGKHVDEIGVPEKACPPEDPKKALELEAKCYVGGDGKKNDHGKARYCVHNHYKHDVRVVWKNAHSNQRGVLEIPAREKRCFWADLDEEGNGRVTLHYNKKQIAEADANLDVVCENDGNGNNDTIDILLRVHAEESRAVGVSGSQP